MKKNFKATSAASSKRAVEVKVKLQNYRVTFMLDVIPVVDNVWKQMVTDKGVLGEIEAIQKLIVAANDEVDSPWDIPVNNKDSFGDAYNAANDSLPFPVQDAHGEYWLTVSSTRHIIITAMLNGTMPKTKSFDIDVANTQYKLTVTLTVRGEVEIVP